MIWTIQRHLTLIQISILTMQHHSPCHLLLSHDQWGLVCLEPPFHHLEFQLIQNFQIKANQNYTKLTIHHFIYLGGRVNGGHSEGHCLGRMKGRCQEGHLGHHQEGRSGRRQGGRCRPARQRWEGCRKGHRESCSRHHQEGCWHRQGGCHRIVRHRWEGHRRGHREGHRKEGPVGGQRLSPSRRVLRFGGAGVYRREKKNRVLRLQSTHIQKH
jgi:hypothetical protein